MEEYSMNDYGVIEDRVYLNKEEDIVPYFEDSAYDLLECGQGYYENEKTVICHTDNKFYKVTINAEIGSQKQDRGDRLYWIEDVNSVIYEEIEKPKPKDRTTVMYKVWVTDDEKIQLEVFMNENGISNLEQMA